MRLLSRINSKAKGSKFERTVAKMFSEVYGVEFHRTPMSGGLHWKQANGISGDIVPPDDISFPYSVECKNVETDWDFDKIISGTSEFWKWWEQAKSDSKEFDKFPFLVFKKNRKEIHCAFIEDSLQLPAGTVHLKYCSKNKDIVITQFTSEIIEKMSRR